MSDIAINHTDANNTVIEDTSTPMSIAIDSAAAAESPADAVSPKSTSTTTTKTPSKRTPKRMSFIERAQKESEELVRTMGGSLELEGGRRTRSSARGTPTRSTDVTPPPAKKARNSPTTTPRGRGRARKLETPVAATETSSSIDEEKVLSPVEHNKAETTPKNRKRKKSENESEDIPPVDHVVDGAKTEDIPVITIEAAKDVTEENNIDHATENKEVIDEDMKEQKQPEEKQEQTPKKKEEPSKTVAIVAVNEITINENKDAAVREENNEVVLEKKEDPIEAMEVDNNTTEAANEAEELVTEQKEDDLSTKAEPIDNSVEQQKDVVVPAAQNEITSSLSHSENEESTAKNGVVHDDATAKLADLPISDDCTNNNDKAEKVTSDLPAGDYVKTPTEISEIKHANNLVAADGGGEPTTVIAVTSCNN